MKSKKFLAPTLILAVTVIAIVVCSLVLSIAVKPTVTEGEFPFSITYELDGKTVTIDDVYKVRYVKNGGYADTKSREYIGEIGNRGENETIYTLKKEGNARVELWTYFYPDYMMGDAEYDYFEEKDFKPILYYFDADEIEYQDEETLAAQGVKLIGFEYPTPIETSLVFSHLSYFSSAVVLPTLLFAILALIAMFIFVKKDKELKYKAVDVISVILNFVIGLTLIPFVIVLALLIDVDGGGPEFYNQVMYFIPALLVLCVAASVALRRMGYGVKSLLAQLVGPVVFAVYLAVCGASGLL